MNADMTAREMLDFICGEFDHVVVAEAAGNFFLSYSPNGVAAEQRLPFATVMVNDANDGCSQLHRPGAYRLNIGVSRATFGTLFDPPGEYDFAVPDQLMPHPVYAASAWVCVVNPGPATLGRVRGLIAEAYALAVGRLERRGGARG